MTTQALHLRLNAIVRRHQMASSLLGVALAWGFLAAIAACLVFLLRPTGSAWAIFTVAVPALAVGLVFLVVTLVRQRRPALISIARRIEQLSPTVDARLITALEQVPDQDTGRFTVLQQQVLSEAAGFLHGDWARTLVPNTRVVGPAGLILLDLALLFAILSSGGFERPTPLGAATLPEMANSEPDSGVSVEPGDIEHERGTSLLVVARFAGELPDRVSLETEIAGGATATQFMAKALDDPVFGIRIPVVEQDFSYRVRFDDRGTRDYRVTVFELPLLVRGDLVVQSPSYTGQDAQRLENAHEVTVVEGSQVTIECRVNKPLASAHLIDAEDRPVAMQRDKDDETLWRYAFTPSESIRWRLMLTDDRGRQNRDPDQFRIQVVPNQPPKLEITFPGKDVRVSPLEELMVEGRVVDDFGIDEYGAVVAVAGRDPVTIPLGTSIASNQPQSIALLQALETLQVAPDDLISYYLYAVDRGPDGETRRTISDLFFAEVRPFEETFRQMDSPPGGASQQSGGASPSGNQFENLVQVQKQIVAATWNMVRAGGGDWDATATEQLAVIAESQSTNKTKLLELSTQLQGAAQQRSAGLAVDQMSAAEQQLETAGTEGTRDPLQLAVASEQAAYQLLLKLRAREHNVIQSQQSGGGAGGSASPSEQQLEQLELSDRQNRYESRSTPGEMQQTAQQEELGTLERLKELARRQGDLNQKLRELDAALRLAQSDAEREEIERQLKRLRDEQQQLLQDADDLRNRLAQSQRQEDFRETREQLEQTRQKMVDATEALRESQLSRALSATTRAENELDTLQQEFRQQTSARFAEAVRELRDATRQTVQQQAQLAEELAGNREATERPSLRSDRSRQDLTNDFETQRGAVQELLERARQVVQDAENAEPLLSQQLYDTLRKARDDQLEPALEAVPQLLQRGFVPEAQRAEEQVRTGLERLQSGIDRAAESVLGNEVEALKRARTEIAELSQQLQNELQQQLRESSGEAGSTAAQNGKSGTAPGQLPKIPAGSGNPSENPSAPVEAATGTQPGKGNSPESSTQSGSGNGQPGEGQPSGSPPGEAAQGEGSGQGTSPGSEGGSGRGRGQGQGQGQGSMPGGEGNQSGSGTGGTTPGNGQGRNAGASGSESSGQPGSTPGNGQLPGNSRTASNNQGGLGGGPGGQGGPISGDGFRDWSDRLRDVESMVSDPGLQAEVAKLREQARSLRAEAKRHSEGPNWDLVQSSLYEPMVELHRRLTEEVAKRESDDALVPIDRDPVPTRYRDLVRSYYERLGQGAE